MGHFGVILNLIQDPQWGHIMPPQNLPQKWMLKHVQHDGVFL